MLRLRGCVSTNGKISAAMNEVRMIAIAGGSGSGKSYLARKLRERMPQDAVLLTLDDFYHDLSGLPEKERDVVNFDDPKAIDWKELERALDELMAGRQAVLPCYDFTTHTRKSEGQVVGPAKWIVLEGLWSLSDPSICQRAACKVFIDCPSELRLMRRIARDTQERGRTEESVRRQFREHVDPMHDRYVQPQGQCADVVLSADFSDVDVEVLWQRANQ